MQSGIFWHLLLAAANVGVGDVGLLLHSHHRHRGINLGRQRDLDLVLVAVHAADKRAQESHTTTERFI